MPYLNENLLFFFRVYLIANGSRWCGVSGHGQQMRKHVLVPSADCHHGVVRLVFSEGAVRVVD